MTANEQTVMQTVGLYGGKAATTLSAFGSLSSAITACTDAGWLLQTGGYYLMTAVGEKALAAALAS